MSIASVEIIQRARAMLGVKFRPQGRDPATGLDCAGLVLWVFGISPDLVRRNYRLRGAHRAEVERLMCRWFERLRQACAGDVMLFAVSGNQDHLAVNCGKTFIHADASRRKVVETPMPAPWPLTAAFRSRSLAQPD